MWYNKYVIKGGDQRRKGKESIMVIMSERKYSVMELIKMLEAALPKGQMVVVGNGESLTAEQKAFLHSLTDCDGSCDCDCDDCDKCDCCDCEYTEADIEEAYNEGYADGESHKEADISEAYDEGYADALREVNEALADLMD